MSSVMRRRNGLIGLSLSVMGLLLSWVEGLETHNLNTEQTLPVTPQSEPPVASIYRDSGLVP